MDLSAEVRWFFPGTIPPRVGVWFRSADPAPRVEAPRQDWYLRTGTTSLGVKLRENRLEIKRRVRERGCVRYSEKVGGCAEVWRKWSIATDPAESSPEKVVVPEDSWVRTLKTRTARAFAVSVEGAVSEIPGPETPEAGCRVELTRVQCREAIWWTLGLEAFGPESEIETVLDRVVHRLVGTGLGERSTFPALDESVSFGYPRWLVESIGSVDGNERPPQVPPVGSR